MKRQARYHYIIMLVTLLLAWSASKAAQPLTLDADGYGKATLDNGVTVLVNQDKTTSLSAARILIGGGVTTETAAINGVSNLMVRMLLRGNATMTAAQIQDQLDFLGATVAADCFRDYVAISFTSLTENFDKVLEILSASLTSPTFPAEELEKLKTEVQGEIKAANDNQSQASSNLFWKTAYGDQGYGLPTLGTDSSVSRLTADDVKAMYQRCVGGHNIIIGVSTDLAPGELLPLLQKSFGAIRPQSETLPAPAFALQSTTDSFVPYERNQSFIYMGFVLDKQDPKSIACITLANQVLGGPVGSRLWGLRQTEKLAYNVFSQYLPSKYATVFRAGIGTDTVKVRLAKASLDREWQRLVKEGISDSEFTDAKVGMKNSLIYGMDRKSVRANNMAFYEYIGYGYRFIPDQYALTDQLTLSDVNTVIRSRLTGSKRFTSIVGKQ